MQGLGKAHPRVQGQTQRGLALLDLAQALLRGGVEGQEGPGAVTSGCGAGQGSPREGTAVLEVLLPSQGGIYG